MNFIFVIAFLASILFYGVILVGGVLFIRRQLQQIRSEDEGSIQHRILDEVETVRYQIEILSDRLRKLEERESRALDSGDTRAPGEGELPPAEGDEGFGLP